MLVSTKISIHPRSMRTKLYHMGIRSQVSRNTLANANNQRDWRIYVKSAPIRQSYPIQFVNPFRSKSSTLSDSIRQPIPIQFVSSFSDPESLLTA